MSDLFEQPDGAATPLTPEEMRDLIPAHIAYRRELNEAEQRNIARAEEWALNRRRDVLTEKFIKDLHRRMLGDVWRWAGRFRTGERNIGIACWEIPVALRQLLDDARAWIECSTYPPDEVAVRASRVRRTCVFRLLPRAHPVTPCMPSSTTARVACPRIRVGSSKFPTRTTGAG